MTSDTWQFVAQLDPRKNEFWPNYQPPASHVAAEVQRPVHLVNGDTLAVAYMCDWRRARESR